MQQMVPNLLMRNNARCSFGCFAVGWQSSEVERSGQKRAGKSNATFVFGNSAGVSQQD